jgi:moderate conductance mechanosensitive channel
MVLGIGMDPNFALHGIDTSKLLDQTIAWLLGPGLRIVVIILVAWVTYRVGRLSITHSLDLALRDRPGHAVANIQISKRRQTLRNLSVTILKVIIFAMAILMILHDLGFEIGPILASAGILGIAIGLGGQSLAKDVIAGAFIILEDQFAVGDVVKINDRAGVVENIGLRTTTLRDQEGTAHIIPNGKIDATSVMTKGWSQIVLDLDVAYNTDLDRAVSAIQKILKEYAAEFPGNVLGEPQVLGIESFADNSVKIRSTLKTAPGKQWDAARLIRRRIKDELTNLGIQAPFQQNIAWMHALSQGQAKANEQKEAGSPDATSAISSTESRQ